MEPSNIPLPVKLPIASMGSKSLPLDGRRPKIHPAEVKGRYTRIQRWVFPTLIAIYAVLPWIHLNGEPLLLIDIAQRRFFFLGLTFNSADFYLSFFVLSGIGFSLVVVSALFGRVWCGYACPQTVFLEGVYRRIERLVEGRPSDRVSRENGPWSAERVARFAAKHTAFILVSLLVANVFLGYFATPGQVLQMMTHPPRDNWGSFLWVAATTALMYSNFAWFREQVCVVICPYGRLQSVLADPDTVVVGYDELRGEPRGRKGSVGAADCVDCRRCVQVCPTGIDIRNGLQLECVGCARCVDACDEVMHKIGREPGLIRYDSQAGLRHQPKRFWRPRLIGYAAAAGAGLLALSLGVLRNQPFEVTLLRSHGAPFERIGSEIANRLVLHVTNKDDTPLQLHLAVQVPAGATMIVPSPDLELAPFENRELPLVVEAPATLAGSDRQVIVRTQDRRSARSVETSVRLLGL